MSGSNTAPKQPGRATGKPFVAKDPRINRKGRPKTSDQAKALILSILHEPALDRSGNEIVVNGHVVTKAEMIFREWVNDPRRQYDLIERAFGKVPQQIMGEDGGPVVIKVTYGRDRSEPTETA